MEQPIIPMRLRDVDPYINVITGEIVDAAVAVQRALGTGLLESAYQAALPHELRLRGRTVTTKVPLDFEYRGLRINRAYEMDLVVDGEVVVELKATECIMPEHFGQLATYLRLSERRVGLLINFRRFPIKSGIHRVVC